MPPTLFQATASEVQTLLVSGRKKEALISAQEGHMWGPALVLAAQLGDQVISIYVTVIVDASCNACFMRKRFTCLTLILFVY